MAIIDILFQDTNDFILEITPSVVVKSPRGISFDGNNYDSTAGVDEVSYVF